MGICRLCKKESELRDSHLIPKAAYKCARQDTNDRLARISIREGSAYYSDEQVKAHLLCTSCEQMFSRNGEDLVGKNWARRSGFRLLETLKSLNAQVTAQRFSFYRPADLDPALLNGLFYFAVSVFWRANVWNHPRRLDPYVGCLGDRYEIKFRKFLLGQGVLSNVRLIVSVNTTSDLNSLISLPNVSRLGTAKVHTFDVLGIRFSLIVGSEIPEDLNKPFEIFRSQILVMSAALEKSPDFIAVVRAVHQKVVARGNLLRDEGGF